MELLNMKEKRSSISSYTEEKLEEEKLTKILHAGLLYAY